MGVLARPLVNALTGVRPSLAHGATFVRLHSGLQVIPVKLSQSLQQYYCRRFSNR
jgi:hypothetical protein